MLLRLAPLALLALAIPALAEPSPPAAPIAQSLQARVEAELAKAPRGTRFGLLVVDAEGRELVAINPDQRFIPASNTKLFTTAAAYALLPGIDQPDAERPTEIYLVPGTDKAPPAVLLVGSGDARLSSAADCKVDCLATLADAIAAKTSIVGDVIGDDAWFTDQRWSLGMSWNNLGGNDATAASALSLDNNELPVEVVWDENASSVTIAASPYVTVANPGFVAAPLPFERPDFQLEHELNSRNFRLYQRIDRSGSQSPAKRLSDKGPWRDTIGIDDPAHYSAWVLAGMLRQRGVKVTGEIRTLHRPVETMVTSAEAEMRLQPGGPVARLVPPPLSEDVTIINKFSQNLHSELLLRRLSVLGSWNTLEEGLKAERELFERAGIPREGFDLYDGSGMSTYNRVSPRAGVALLRWIDRQPWAAAYHASLPVAGVDGTLRRRFLGTPLAGNLQAKTGSLNATNALTGTFRSARGQRLTFSFFANDVPEGQSAVPAMEAALLLIAAAN